MLYNMVYNAITFNIPPNSAIVLNNAQHLSMVEDKVPTLTMVEKMQKYHVGKPAWNWIWLEDDPHTQLQETNPG